MLPFLSFLGLRHRLVGALSLIAAVVVGLGFAAGARAASSAEFYGVNTQPMTKDPDIAPGEWDRWLGQVEAGKMGSARLEVNWRYAEPTAPVGGVHKYEWNAGGTGSRISTDYAVAALAKRGIRAAPLFATVPAWASPNAYRMTSANYPDFAAFIAGFATRYGPGGAFWSEHPELPQLPTYDYEIWTEANSTNFWTGKRDPVEYAAAMKLIHPALKAAQPSALLLISLGWQSFAQYLDQYWAAGGGDAFDAVGFHPYAPHGPAIIGLVQQLRAKLRTLGRGGIPTMVTESGQPVVLSGAGASSAGSGLVTDSARAATQAFAADVLARSNCGVEQFLEYAIVGSETSREPGSEGFMGIFRRSDASANLTGAALQRASQRWVQQFGAGNAASNSIEICGGTGDPAKLLPLGLTLKRSGPTCVIGTITYDGNPLEGARLEYSATGRASYTKETYAAGQAEVCHVNGPTVKTFDVTARVPGMAASAVARCDLPVTSCGQIAPAPSAPGSPTVDTPGAGGGGAAAGGSTICKCAELLTGDAESPTAGGTGAQQKPTSETTACAAAASIKLERPERASRGRLTVKAKAKLTCATAKSGAKVRFVVAVRKKGSKKDSKLRTVTLRNYNTVSFSVTSKLKKGDQLVLLHTVAKKPIDDLPRIRVTATLKAPR